MGEGAKIAQHQPSDRQAAANGHGVLDAPRRRFASLRWGLRACRRNHGLGNSIDAPNRVQTRIGIRT